MGISWKDREVAGIFDKARGVPEEAITGIFSEIFERTGFAGKEPKLLDAGCGTGRISVPIAKNFPGAKITGIDVSDQMLSQLKAKLEKGRITNYEVKQASLLGLNEPGGHYDFCIISSVLHAIPEWKKAVDNAVHATGGYLVLLTETSDMYRLVLNRQEPGDGLLERFWGKYSILRKRHGLPDVESTQVGIKWQLGCPEVLEYLNAKGKIESRFELSRSWITEFLVADLLEIVEKKAYSSMFAVDEEAYGRVVSDLKKWLKEENLPESGKAVANNDMLAEAVKLAAKA